MRRTPRVRSNRRAPALVDISAIYEKHAAYVSMNLRRLGIQSPDLDDVRQEVFMIVHRRLNTFDGRGQGRVTAWLFGICLRVAANYRRGRRRTEKVFASGDAGDQPALLAPADDLVARREQRNLADWALSRLDVEKRATFVMFEVESLSCGEIAAIRNVPVGTVYSRLNSARRQIEKMLERQRRRDPEPAARSPLRECGDCVPRDSNDLAAGRGRSFYPPCPPWPR